MIGIDYIDSIVLPYLLTFVPLVGIDAEEFVWREGNHPTSRGSKPVLWEQYFVSRRKNGHDD